MLEDKLPTLDELNSKLPTLDDLNRGLKKNRGFSTRFKNWYADFIQWLRDFPNPGRY